LNNDELFIIIPVSLFGPQMYKTAGRITRAVNIDAIIVVSIRMPNLLRDSA